MVFIEVTLAVENDAGERFMELHFIKVVKQNYQESNSNGTKDSVKDYM